MAASSSQTSLLLLSLLALTAASTTSATFHDDLKGYGFPPGLFPDSVSSYSISGDGTFSVSLESSCSLQLEYLISFDSVITGTIAYGHISGMTGFKALSADGVFLDIDQVKVVGSILEFSIGPLTVTSDASEFETIPTCNALKVPKLISKLRGIQIA